MRQDQTRHIEFPQLSEEEHPAVGPLNDGAGVRLPFKIVSDGCAEEFKGFHFLDSCVVYYQGCKWRRVFLEVHDHLNRFDNDICLETCRSHCLLSCRSSHWTARQQMATSCSCGSNVDNRENHMSTVINMANEFHREHHTPC